MSLGFKRLGVLFLFCAIFFSCKNEIAGDKNEFLSQSASSSLSGASNTLGINSIDLDKYDVKSGLGPVSVTECSLDAKTFASTPEKFETGFNADESSMPFVKINSEEKFQIEIKKPSDIWYVFTNATGEEKALPSFSIPGSGSSDNPEDEIMPIDKYDLPDLAFVHDTEKYVRGPGNIDLNKTIFPKDYEGKSELYTYFSYPKKWSFSCKTLALNSKVADEIAKKYEGTADIVLHKYIASNNQGVWAAIGIGGGATAVAGAAVYLGATTPIYFSWLVPAIVGGASLLGTIATTAGTAASGDLYPNKIVQFTVNYKQFVDLILGRARSTNKKYKDTALPSIADGDFELYQLNAKNNDNSEIGKITSSRMLTDYYYIPNEILYFPYQDSPFDSSSSFWNRMVYKLSNKVGDIATEKLWIPDDTCSSVYNYIKLNYYNYENKSDSNAFYVTEGALGFGVYIPYLKWFYPIYPTMGKKGYGYYMGDRLMLRAPESYDVSGNSDEEEDTIYESKIDKKTINFFNNNFSSSSVNAERLTSITQNRVENNEVLPPIRLIPKEDSNLSDLQVKASPVNYTSNLGDKVGEKQVFVEPITSPGYDYYRVATCKLVKKVNTAFGQRYIVVYEDDNLTTKPTDAEYEKIVDAFLADGQNNDIYDKITNVFGSEWGYYNSTFLKSLVQSNTDIYIPLIPKTDTITLFYTDLGNVGDSSEYLSAAYLPYDMYLNSENALSNERLMIHVHAPKAGGDNLCEGLMGIAREFERLIHDQYFSENLSNYCYAEQVDKFGFERPIDNSGFSDYFFSFLAKVIAANTLDRAGYSIPKSYDFNLDNDFASYTDLFGLAQYYLYGMDKFDIGSLTLANVRGDADYQLIAKAVMSSFAYYIYTNFGSGFIQAYTLGNKAGLEGIVSAINSVYNTNWTLSYLLTSWAVATVRSSIISQSRPATFNYVNRFKVMNVEYPNIDFSKIKPYKINSVGVPSSSSGVVLNNSNVCYKVKNGWNGLYKAKAPKLDGLSMYIVAVPSSEEGDGENENVFPKF